MAEGLCPRYKLTKNLATSDDKSSFYLVVSEVWESGGGFAGRLWLRVSQELADALSAGAAHLGVRLGLGNQSQL